MNYFKTIALALAISTGACTVQAGPPEQVTPKRTFSTVLSACFNLGMGAYLTHLTTKPISYGTLHWAAKLVEKATYSVRDKSLMAHIVYEFDLERKVRANQLVLRTLGLYARTISQGPIFMFYLGLLRRISPGTFISRVLLRVLLPVQPELTNETH